MTLNSSCVSESEDRQSTAIMSAGKGLLCYANHVIAAITWFTVHHAWRCCFACWPITIIPQSTCPFHILPYAFYPQLKMLLFCCINFKHNPPWWIIIIIHKMVLGGYLTQMFSISSSDARY